MFLEQLRVGSMGNFCYILGDEEGGMGVVVDPAFEPDTILHMIKKLKLNVSTIVLTHHHFDHINAASAIKARTGALIEAHRACEPLLRGDIHIDRYIIDGADLDWGGKGKITILHTPGHAPGAICLIADDKWLITGDTLFIGNCGRTDLEGGDSNALYKSLARIKRLPDHLLVCPGHDYGHAPMRILGEEKILNPALAAESFDEFQAVP